MMMGTFSFKNEEAMKRWAFGERTTKNREDISGVTLYWLQEDKAGEKKKKKREEIEERASAELKKERAPN